LNTENQLVQLPLLQMNQVSLFVKREDRIHPIISGNKYRKLKYNLIEAKNLGFQTLLTFGGAFSNHIAATACVGYEQNFDTIGIIRGEELKTKWEENPTLKLAASHGMRLYFVDRETYKNKQQQGFVAFLKKKYGGFYLLPEGGANALAVKGCEEILKESDDEFDVVCSAVGTGGTLAGLVNSAQPNQRIMGFPVLKGDFLKQDIRKFASNKNWELVNDYHFGGYAKINKDLVEFINRFKKETGIALDPIYTGKMMFGIFDMVKKGTFNKNTKILAIHTGGLQGISGMNRVLKKKGLPLIDL
jgi:1-aminocyclopropane-1-carboxylate deaminase